MKFKKWFSYLKLKNISLSIQVFFIIVLLFTVFIGMQISVTNYIFNNYYKYDEFSSLDSKMSNYLVNLKNKDNRFETIYSFSTSFPHFDRKAFVF